MNVQQLMKQAQQMQDKLQKQMETIVVDATAGGGMVSVKMNGQKQLRLSRSTRKSSREGTRICSRT
jgi:DNA-binding protein YbaB